MGVKVFHDFEGRSVRLSEERLSHILGHPEMKDMLEAIKQTIAFPQKVVQSLSDTDAYLHYRFYVGTRVGDKYLCVVVKIRREDAFILTAYLTDTIKKGELIWPKKS